MLDSAQDLVAVFLGLAFVWWLLSGRLALGKHREPRGASSAPLEGSDLPALAGARPLLEETSDRLIRPKVRSEVATYGSSERLLTA